MLRSFLIIFSIAILVSCSQQSSKTKANFRFTMGALGTPANFSGGLIVYGKMAMKPDLFVRVLTSNNLSDEIPNGMWTFYAIGWDEATSGQQMSGKVYCGELSNMSLDGVAKEVNLNVSNLKCKEKVFTSHFKESSSTISFPDIEIETCKNLSDEMLDDGSKVCNYDSSSDTYIADKGFAGSYKILVRSSNQFFGEADFKSGILSSNCVPVAKDTLGGLDTTGFGLNIPTGNAVLNTPFKFYLRSYYTDDCSETKGYKEMVLDHGVKTNKASIKSVVYDNGAELRSKIFAKTNLLDVCKDERLDAEFAAGFGTAGHPYVICNLSQFNNINNHLTKSFALGANLDFVSQTALNIFPKLLCTHFKDNFIPIGSYTDPGSDTHPADCTSNASQFSGNFDGLNHTISNVTLEKAGTDFLGLFRHIQNGSLLNLTVENADITGKVNVGVVGKCDGCHLFNVTVKNSRIEGDSDTGAVVGHVLNLSNLNKLVVYDSKVVGNGKVGGIVGTLTGTSTFEQGLAEGIFIQSEGNTAGGAIGKIDNSTAEQIGVKGFIKSDGQSVGGVVGEISNTTSLTHAYAHVYIDSDFNDSDARVGGIAGVTSSSVTVGSTYVIGKIDHECDAGDDNCKIGCVIGNSASTNNENYCQLSLYNTTSILGGDSGSETYTDGGFAQNLTADKLRLENGFFKSVIESTTGHFNDDKEVWTTTNDMLPRFSFEPEKPCHLAVNLAPPAAQIDTGRGDLKNPVTICNPIQLGSIPDNSTKIYSLEESFRLGVLNNVEKMVHEFEGVFNGNNKILFDGKIDLSSDPADYAGIFKVVSTDGIVKDLQLYGMNMESGGQTASGAIAGKNNGTIENVKVQVVDSNFENIGGVAGKNFGTIKKALTTGSIVTNLPSPKFGGIASINSGTISECYSDVHIFRDGNMQNVGGIAKQNSLSGIISECESAVSIEAVASSQFIGGVVSKNLGTIRNSYFSEDGEILLERGSEVGGVVGFNSADGLVKNTYSAGSVYFTHDTEGTETVGQGVAGSSTGAVETSFARQKSVGFNVGTVYKDDTFTGYSCTANRISLTPGVDDSGNSSEIHSKTYHINDVIKLIGSNENEVLTSFEEFEVTDDVELSFTASGCPQVFTNPEEITEITFISPITSTFGTEKSSDDLKFQATFTSSGFNWDLVAEDSLEFNNRVEDRIKGQLGLDESQLVPPLWIIEDDQGFPYLYKVREELLR